MSTKEMEFTPLGNDKEIHLRQVTEAEVTGNAIVPAEQVEAREVMTLPVPRDEIDILVGMIDGTGPAGLQSLLAGNIASGLAVFLGCVAAGLWIFYAIRRDLLEGLLCEPGPNGKASLSRFQALIFTFVVSGSVAIVIAETGEFPEIPWQLLAILTGSLGTFLISKGIQQSGSGSGGGSTPNTAPIATKIEGGLLRLGTGAMTEKVTASGLKDQTTGSSTSIYVASAEGINHNQTVAVAVGTCALKIQAEALKGSKWKEPQLSYVDEEGKNQSKPLSSEQSISTDPNSVSEVRVSFGSETPASQIKITVSEA